MPPNNLILAKCWNLHRSHYKDESHTSFNYIFPDSKTQEIRVEVMATPPCLCSIQLVVLVSKQDLLEAWSGRGQVNKSCKAVCGACAILFRAGTIWVILDNNCNRNRSQNKKIWFGFQFFTPEPSFNFKHFDLKIVHQNQSSI